MFGYTFFVNFKIRSFRNLNMKKISVGFVLLFFTVVQHGQIIADHTVVERYDDIPQQYIDSVKKMLVFLGGESHASGYWLGAEILERLNPRFQVLIYDDHEYHPPPSDEYLRLGQPVALGEQIYTKESTINSIKNRITAQVENNNPYAVVGFGWCYDMTWVNDPGGGVDPKYNVRWAGSSADGPDGNQRWGLDSEDSILTGNRINMDTYLTTVKEYNDYCDLNGYSTKFILNTGPVDSNAGTENGFQRELKNQHIRDYAKSNPDAILFDFADILVHNSSGERYTVIWDDGGTLRPHDQIHPDNRMDYDENWNIIPLAHGTTHLGNVGEVRIAKAFWWMLARIAGWDGTVNGEDTTPPSVPSDLSTAIVTESSVEIFWTASTDNVGVTSYNVYRDGALLSNTASTSYTDNTVASCAEYTYTVRALDAAGNESSPSAELIVSTCASDLAPTLIVTPNISHGVTSFDVIIRVTELNLVQTTGEIIVQIPIDNRWGLIGSYDQTLTTLDGMPLDNRDWTHTSDATYHIFTTSASIASGGSSTFGFSISFDPGTSKGEYTITTQLVNGAGGETRYTNNTDSERLDYFPEGT